VSLRVSLKGEQGGGEKERRPARTWTCHRHLPLSDVFILGVFVCRGLIWYAKKVNDVCERNHVSLQVVYHAFVLPTIPVLTSSGATRSRRRPTLDVILVQARFGENAFNLVQDGLVLS
jgi:hypothetical protein